MPVNPFDRDRDDVDVVFDIHVVNGRLRRADLTKSSFSGGSARICKHWRNDTSRPSQAYSEKKGRFTALNIKSCRRTQCQEKRGKGARRLVLTNAWRQRRPRVPDKRSSRCARSRPYLGLPERYGRRPHKSRPLLADHGRARRRPCA